MPLVKVEVTPKQYRTLWHPNMYILSRFGILSLKQYTIYALHTSLLCLGLDDNARSQLPRNSMRHSATPNVYPHTKFEIPASNYITYILPTRFRFRLTDGQIVSCVSGLRGAHHHLWLQKSAAPSNQICMIEFTYDAVGCAYLIGLQIALEAVEFAESQSRL